MGCRRLDLRENGRDCRTVDWLDREHSGSSVLIGMRRAPRAAQCGFATEKRRPGSLMGAIGLACAAARIILPALPEASAG